MNNLKSVTTNTKEELTQTRPKKEQITKHAKTYKDQIQNHMQGILSTKKYDTKNNQIRKNNVKLDLREKEKKAHKDTFKATKEKETQSKGE